MPKKKRSDSNVNPELKGFKIEVDKFGEIKTNFDIDKINSFLNRKVKDKKLLDRDDYKTIIEEDKTDSRK